MIDSIKQIKEAEENARKGIETAQREAAERTKLAEEEADRILEENLQATQREVGQIRANRTRQAEAEAANILESLRQEAKLLELRASARIETAAKSIMHHIVGGD